LNDRSHPLEYNPHRQFEIKFLTYCFYYNYRFINFNITAWFLLPEKSA
jgi:hypothetical protein